ncbi:MAG: UDP-N-acetylmuramate:L-alanyl-gamma-D-glutamyl-meso-diaminopimelate ligase [Oleispira antarctica]|nr:UDP-N-acetylmuramate:L-alanyl-gamma-D-glutamyl-meso-diaminopimelate ligase [Oleispira antarctica]MBQ0794306.1 UDP-N-acetylmuramate:L-alanyl-gamma-D-glutamyl-meso-diaminopimelate ligase [Oleispira antarctica]
MHLHILGICGTFMGSLAQLAKAQGHKVTGSDQGIYPPMSDQLAQAGIDVIAGFDPEQLDPAPDYVIVGNAMSRGNPAVEYVLDRGLPYISGPDWMGKYLLADKWVMAVAGTHGKTTTSSMLAWILEFGGMNPGYLIGGVPENFSTSARLTDSNFFIIEADEYDTAFFDKRSKFVHYHPRTLVMNNLEFDHADIFDDLAAIERQFHHLVRTVPSTGQVIYPVDNAALQRVIAQGCWSEQALLNHSGGWMVEAMLADCSQFNVLYRGENVASVIWKLSGEHNMANALAAIVAARHVGIEPHIAAEALAEFQSVKRRMELVGEVGVKGGGDSIRIYDDFAHHPTAIKLTLSGAKAAQQVQKRRGRLIAVLEPRSNTMKLGEHKAKLAASVEDADASYWLEPEGLSWSLTDAVSGMKNQQVFDTVEALEQRLLADIKSGDDVVMMSNGSFSGIHRSLLAKLLDRVAVENKGELL